MVTIRCNKATHLEGINRVLLCFRSFVIARMYSSGRNEAFGVAGSSLFGSICMWHILLELVEEGLGKTSSESATRFVFTFYYLDGGRHRNLSPESRFSQRATVYVEDKQFGYKQETYFSIWIG